MVLTRREAIEYMRPRIVDYLRDKKGIDASNNKSFCCLSPNHRDSSPSMKVKYDHAHCFGCGENYGLFDIIGMDYHCENDFDEQLRIACDLYGVEIRDDEDRNTRRGSNTSLKGDSKAMQQTEGATQKPLETTADYTALIEGAYKALWETSAAEDARKYLKSRGLSEDILQAFRIGYIPRETFKDKSNVRYERPAICIPYGANNCYYTTRATTSEHFFSKPNSSEAGSEPLFNADVLSEDSNAPVFIVEAALCAMSIHQEGGKAVALCGTGMKKLISTIQERGAESRMYIVCLDNDATGEKNTGSLLSALSEIGAPAIAYNLTAPHGCKDPNELLQKDPDALRDEIEKAERTAESARQDAEKAAEAKRMEAFTRHSAGARLQELYEDIINCKKIPPVSTGFRELDDFMGGGLAEGLITIGAVSSLGKTAFALQIMDYVAQQGRDVFIFSLEMSKDELITRSVSRHTKELAIEANYRRQADKTQKKSGEKLSVIGKIVNMAKSVTQLTRKAKEWTTSEEDVVTVTDAFQAYSKYADRIFIFEGVADIGVAEIREKVENFITATGGKKVFDEEDKDKPEAKRKYHFIGGRRPVVLVDYVQILAAPDEKRSFTDKQIADRNVVELKRLTRDAGIPLIAISSFNRNSYDSEVNQASFKETGLIEYSSDMLIGLQHEGMARKRVYDEKAKVMKFETPVAHEYRIASLMERNAEQIKDGNSISIEAVILKNRYGERNVRCLFDYDPAHNYFESSQRHYNPYQLTIEDDDEDD